MFCSICGKELREGAKFCDICGSAVQVQIDEQSDSSKRRIVYEGSIHKCPNCGEKLNSFLGNCPACGFELREIKTSSAIKEFANKLEIIESKREVPKKKKIRDIAEDRTSVSKTDQQKINLIQNFAVPNSKEDILEFMILATSNINYNAYNVFSSYTTPKDDAINEAWLSKIRQVYEKANILYGESEEFNKIQKLYDGCKKKIKGTKRKNVFIFFLMFFWIPIVFVVIAIKSPGIEKKEVARLEKMEQVAIESLENKEYKKALLYAEKLDFNPSIKGKNYDELSDQWRIKKELLIDKILDAAKADGVELQYTPEETTEDNKDVESGGFIDGFEDGFKDAVTE